MSEGSLTMHQRAWLISPRQGSTLSSRSEATAGPRPSSREGTIPPWAPCREGAPPGAGTVLGVAGKGGPRPPLAGRKKFPGGNFRKNEIAISGPENPGNFPEFCRRGSVPDPEKGHFWPFFSHKNPVVLGVFYYGEYRGYPCFRPEGPVFPGPEKVHIFEGI